MILLTNHAVIKTRDREVARSQLFELYKARSFDVAPRGLDDFSLRSNNIQIDALGLCSCSFDGVVSLGFGEDDMVRQVFSVGGGGACWTAGNWTGDLAPDASTPILPSQTATRFELDSGYRHLVLRIDAQALQRHLQALLGCEMPQPLTFGNATAHDSAIRSLRSRVIQFATDFDVHGRHLSQIAAEESARKLISDFLIFNRHSHSDLLLSEPADDRNETVRLVESYIEAHWSQPLDAATLARVAGVSARTLARQFRRHRGYLPTDFIKQHRLQRARDMLQSADDRCTVTLVALKCGFQNLGHFARDFRQLFGVLPSELLRRSRAN